jgi:hypothetical protein
MTAGAAHRPHGGFPAMSPVSLVSPRRRPGQPYPVRRHADLP